MGSWQSAGGSWQGEPRWVWCCGGTVGRTGCPAAPELGNCAHPMVPGPVRDSRLPVPAPAPPSMNALLACCLPNKLGAKPASPPVPLRAACCGRRRGRRATGRWARPGRRGPGTRCGATGASRLRGWASTWTSCGCAPCWTGGRQRMCGGWWGWRCAVPLRGRGSSLAAGWWLPAAGLLLVWVWGATSQAGAFVAWVWRWRRLFSDGLSW